MPRPPTAYRVGYRDGPALADIRERQPDAAARGMPGTLSDIITVEAHDSVAREGRVRCVVSMSAKYYDAILTTSLMSAMLSRYSYGWLAGRRRRFITSLPRAKLPLDAARAVTLIKHLVCCCEKFPPGYLLLGFDCLRRCMSLI